ncbi:NADPH:quinone reductase-like Zn-dependent oxidoreductase [Stackebrandtia albiflava]|uniref:NADPH:quinone reductase-like Zn-dependent oxidoreductase n=1 Tax=Stackebrandtia albiflava TaxID=406432 RepID=A0A562VDZ7_9ACTN|nr:zinc-dependent alcohol dehydrogenase family protein [Stackebrandtia albiflava]TWJ16037.1 NADPH:quinone reductase-like Zn-dependent oxidoreductase [Stackebrandtia albiflava]
MSRPVALSAARFGRPADVLRLVPVLPPPLRPGQVRVAMSMSPVNPSDLIPVTGAYATRTVLPFVPGFEGVGRVVGSRAPGLPVGRRVIPIGSAGGWQTVKTTDADWCVPVPDDLDDRVAATSYVNPLTAVSMVESLALHRPEVVAVNAAGSATAGMVAALLAARGVEVIGVARRSPGAPRAGFHRFVDVSADPDAVDRLPRCDAVFDCVGGRDGARLAARLRPGGVLFHYGLLSGEPLPRSVVSRPDVTVEFFRLRDRVHRMERGALRSAFDEVFDLLRRGVFRTSIAAEYRLTAWPVALRHALRPAVGGKILLRP